MDRIGIIGGSGLDDPRIVEQPVDVAMATPYGNPSAALKCGRIAGREVALIGRHGREHTHPPAQVNYRANIHALKEAGCTHILATTAVGSLRDEIRRGDLVVPDQFIDFTRRRKATFFESFAPHHPMHTQMADPFDARLRNLLIAACRELGFRCHPAGTLITIEGPRFSTRAESHMFRQWGADIVNMSVATEVMLAQEAGLPYAAVAMCTDYDCWKTDEPPATWQAILEVFRANAEKVTRLLAATIPRV